MRAVAVIGVLAACGPTSAIEVVVDTPDDPRIDTVKIYVGIGYRMNESGADELLIPAGYQYAETPKGLRFKRQRELDTDTIEIGPDSSAARWVFQPGTHDELSVIAIGYAGGQPRVAGAFHEQAMRAGTLVERHVALAPATPPFPVDERGSRIVQEWGPTDDAKDCAHYRDPEHSIYIVTEDDRDCDGLVEADTTKECRKDVHAGYVREKDRSKASCLRSDPTVPGACVLGAAGCNESAQPSAACNVPTTTCTDPEVCLRCAVGPGGVPPLDCAANLAHINSTTTRLECSFFYEPSGPICGTTAALTDDTFPRVTAPCDPAQDYMFYNPGASTWTAGKITRGPHTFVADKPTSGCGFRLTWQNPGSPSTISEPILSIASGQLMNGRSAAIPMLVAVRPTADCANVENGCKMANPRPPELAFTRCLATPLVEPW